MANDSPAKSLVDIDLSSLRDPAGIFELVEVVAQQWVTPLPRSDLIMETMAAEAHRKPGQSAKAVHVFFTPRQLRSLLSH
ncbi:hypothetical protein SKAU_G00250520 [Synaphobranchus kaupii]|uniref:Uncharacterized protein n=1 Tax=Synaphobranchus kaupii TaxID=118154 RepID=A0A9Q1F354_SYNKA|nr:hypothetical protein SKAU_G00250520 [Synaphobranchus kaupii]